MAHWTKRYRVQTTVMPYARNQYVVRDSRTNKVHLHTATYNEARYAAIEMSSKALGGMNDKRTV